MPVRQPSAARPHRVPRWAFAPLAILAVLVLVLGAWVVDTASAGESVRRNVEVAGRAVGRQSPEELRATLDQVATAYAATPVALVAPAGEVVTTAAAVGLAVDVDATAREVLAVGEGGGALGGPGRWLRSFTDEVVVPLRFRIDHDLFDDTIEDVAAQNASPPVEPALALTDGVFTSTPGAAGAVLDSDRAEQRLLDAAVAAQLGAVRLELAVTEQAPVRTDAEVQALVAEANDLTDEPLTLEVGGRQVVVPTATMRPWISAVDAPGGALELRLDEPTVSTDVTALIGPAGDGVTQLRWEVDGEGRVSFVEGSPGSRCCAPDTATRVIDALRVRQGSVALDLEVVAPDHDAAWAESMQIREPIGSFTTNHPCCKNRVTNIHLMADSVRGVVIAPGETFSINDHVGKRTTAKGYLEDGVIYNGKLTKDVGGGVSQFATTLFNAAFFGGLDIPEYQMHTQYFDRYPYGREATLSYPSPDLKLHNNTPYGVLLWPTYSDTSITVTLYSTPWVRGEQTNQTRSAAGACTRVRTERTRTWLEDDRTETDTFSTLYQPADGVKC